MQVYSAQTNKKNLCLRFWVSPSLASVSFLANLAWLIIVFVVDRDGKRDITDPPLDCWYSSSSGICTIQSRRTLLRGSTLGGGRDFAILRSSNRDFCALAVDPRRNVCHWPAHSESLFFILHLFLILMNLVTMQQKSVVNWLCLVQLSLTT